MNTQKNIPYFGMNEIPFKFNPHVLSTIVVVIFVLFGIFTSFYTVDQKEQAVILRLGKYNRTTDPGLHFKLPFGIEKKYKVPTGRNLLEEFGFRTEDPGVVSRFSSEDFASESYMLTGDLNIVEVTWSIQYQVRDPRAWLFNLEDQNKTIRDISRSVMNRLVGDLAVSDVVTGQRAQIQEKGKVMMNEILYKYNLGIEILEVKLQKTLAPKGSVQDAFEDVNRAQQDLLRLINEGKESYNREIPRARGEAQKTIREAEGYAIEKVNKAKGDVARFLAVVAQYKKNPQSTRMRLYYEMFDDLFKNTENIELIDKQLKNFIPFKSLNTEKTKKGDEQ